MNKTQARELYQGITHGMRLTLRIAVKILRPLMFIGAIVAWFLDDYAASAFLLALTILFEVWDIRESLRSRLILDIENGDDIRIQVEKNTTNP